MHATPSPDARPRWPRATSRQARITAATVQIAQRTNALSMGARSMARSAAAISASESARPRCLALRAASTGRIESAARTHDANSTAPSSGTNRASSPLAMIVLPASAKAGADTSSASTAVRPSSASTTCEPRRVPGVTVRAGKASAGDVDTPSL